MKEKKEKKAKEPKVKLTKAEKREQKGNFGERFSLKFRRKLIANKARTWLLVIVLIAIFIALNAWARTKATAQIDLTESKIYTLSQTSKDQLASLDKEVMIYIYGYDDSNSYVTFIKQYAEYNDNIKYEIVTTESNYEIINEYDLDSTGYPALLVKCGDRDVTLYPDYEFSSYDYVNGTYATVDLTEESITNAILNVSTDDPTKVYFVTGHGEYVTDYVTLLTQSLEDVVYECEDLNLISATEIPADCDILVFLNPASDISASEAEVLRAYINNGGNMFVAWFKDINTSAAEFPNFQSILDLYGAGVEKGLLYEGSSTNYYYYPYYLMPNVSTSSEITADIATSGYYPLLLESQRVLTNEVDEENVTVSTESLLTTSDSCYNITNIDAINQGLSLEGLDQSSYTVAQKYTRSISISDDEDSDTIDSNLILIGSTTFLLDQNGALSYDANQSFVLNSFASLAGENDLITVQKYSSTSTAFTKTPTTFADAIVKVIIFGVPVIIILVGIIIWAVRRRKR